MVWRRGRAPEWHAAAPQVDGWASTPRELLVEVVRLLRPRDARAMHRVCVTWRDAVRAGVRHLAPVSPHFAGVRDLFTAVRACSPSWQGQGWGADSTAFWSCKPAVHAE